MRVNVRRSTRGSWLGMVVSGMVMIAIAIKMFSIAGDMKALEERCTQSTTGVVTDVEAQKRTSGSKSRRRTYYVYFTKFVYTANNVDVEATTTFSERERLDVGNEVPVHYNPDIPTECYAGESDADSFPKSAIIVVMVMGVIFVLVGFKMMTMRR